MILIFHVLTKFFYNLWKKCLARGASLHKTPYITDPNSHPLAQRDAENSIKFDPPVFKQRYERATNLLLDDKWKNQITKVVDFGCAEFGLFVFLKNAIKAREMLFVDVDALMLKDNLYRIYPLTADYLARSEDPLNVKVLSGSISDPNSSLQGADAVLAIEIIEHLYPDTLDALPYNLFEYISPKLVIVTTPNQDFNVLFNKLEKFRHYDHKFEWTREQFESWATNITSRFPKYTVQFDGVGLGPAGSEHLGCCSQLALFVRKDIICDNYVEEIIPCICKSIKSTHLCSCNCVDCKPQFSYGVCTYCSLSQKKDNYELLVSVDYPHYVDTRSEDEKILSELKYRLHRFDNNPDFYNYERDRMEIPIDRFVYQSSTFSPSETEMKTLLLKFNYQIEECLNEETNQLETCLVYEPVMDNLGSSSDTEASGYESDRRNTEDWDEKGNEKESDVKAQLHLDVSSKKQEALFDSGYQKSPSVPDDLPTADKQEAIPLEFKTLTGDKPNRLSNILSVFENFDKVNELDALRREKKYFSFASNLPHREVMKKICQEIAKHGPVAGPSRDPKKCKHSNKPPSSDSDESVDEVRAITTCILENSLNKIECQEDEQPRGDLIQEFMQDFLPEENQLEEEAVVEALLLVENGDLANNNRDVEGNNYPENGEDPPLDIVDNIDHNNVNIDNNNEVEEAPPPGLVEEAARLVEEVVRNVEAEAPVEVEVVAWSSREALFDVNSHVDLLEDFDMDASVAAVNGVVYPTSCVMVVDGGSEGNDAVLPQETGFPNWLLQIFDEGEAGVPEEELHDEPHFYCQGDGLGVHPSTVAINDDADDEGNDSDSDSDAGSSSTSSSSSESSAEYENAENHTDDGAQPTDNNIVVVGQSLSHQSDTVDVPEPEEVFENAEGSETNLIASSCTQ